jgi:hypothetical protein
MSFRTPFSTVRQTSETDADSNKRNLFMPRTAQLAAILLALATSTALADSTAPANKPTSGLVRGTIASYDGHQLEIRTQPGELASAIVSINSRIFVIEPRTLAQLKSTDFVGVTAVDSANGHLRAEEIHIIPIAGVGEGQYPWDHHPDNVSAGAMGAGSMTNGTVQAAMPSRMGSMTNGTVGTTAPNELTLTFHGSQSRNGRCEGRAASGGCVGTAVVDVTPSTYIAALVPGKADALKPGLAVVAGIRVAPDGKSFVSSATVEKNGVKPEF